MSTVESNWFRCVSSRDCDPEVIKSLLKIFKNQIHMLLETIVNLVDSNVSFGCHITVLSKCCVTLFTSLFVLDFVVLLPCHAQASVGLMFEGKCRVKIAKPGLCMQAINFLVT